MQKRFLLSTILILIMTMFLSGCSKEQETSLVYENVEIPLVYGGSVGFRTYLDCFLYVDDEAVAEESTEEFTVLSVGTGDGKLSYYDKMIFIKDCLEKYLPDAGLVCAWLPADTPMRDYCEGDIGNDGVNDIAVIIGSHIYVLRKEEEGYRLVGDNMYIVEKKDETLDIVDGKLICSQTEVIKDSHTKYFEFDYRDSQLVLTYKEESYYYAQSGQGLQIKYYLDQGIAEAYAYTKREDGFAPRLVYSGELFKRDGQVPTYSFDKTEYIKPIIEGSTIVYSKEEQDYDYRALPVEEMAAEGGWEPWQIAYMEVMRYYTTCEKDWYNESIYFSLAYIDEDDIPELVLDFQYRAMAVFTYAPGHEVEGIQNVSAVMDFFPYGGMGIMGYYYCPGENIIFYDNKDHCYGGFIEYTGFCYIDENKELDVRYSVAYQYVEVEGVWEEIYYYNGEEVTQEVYDSYYASEDACGLGDGCLAWEMVEKLREY